jgi:hypothetical protein
MSAGADSPKQLAQVQTGDNSEFFLKFDRSSSRQGVSRRVGAGTGSGRDELDELVGELAQPLGDLS